MRNRNRIGSLVLFVLSMFLIPGDTYAACVRSFDYLEHALQVSGSQSEEVMINGEIRTLWTSVSLLVFQERAGKGQDNSEGTPPNNFFGNTGTEFFMSYSQAYENGDVITEVHAYLSLIPNEDFFTPANHKAQHFRLQTIIREKNEITDEFIDIPIDLAFWATEKVESQTGRTNGTGPGLSIYRTEPWREGRVIGYVGDLVFDECGGSPCPNLYDVHAQATGHTQHLVVQLSDSDFWCQPKRLR